MLAIILKILSVLGIILLVLLGILLLAVLLVLFFPISYRMKGHKNPEEVKAGIKVDWLFGLIRARYDYPEPNKLLVKVLCFMVYDSSAPAIKETPSSKEKASDKTRKESTGRKNKSKKKQEYHPAINYALLQDEEKPAKSAEEIPKPKPNTTAGPSTEHVVEEQNEEKEENPSNIFQKLSAKYKKIKYTILKIYDKIKWIIEHISFYKELWEETETQELFKYTCSKLLKIWKSVRPRKFMADILYGAPSPDTTGYIYAVYGMICSYLGKDVIITPDFTQAILEGKIDIAGRITIFVILINALKVAFDKRLKRLIHRVKRYEAICKKKQVKLMKEREQQQAS